MTRRLISSLLVLGLLAVCPAVAGAADTGGLLLASAGLRTLIPPLGSNGLIIDDTNGGSQKTYIIIADNADDSLIISSVLENGSGVAINFNGSPYSGIARSADGMIFFPAWQFIESLYPDAVISRSGQSVSAEFTDGWVKYDPKNQYIIANDRYLYISDTLTDDDGTVYLSVDLLARATGAQVTEVETGLNIAAGTKPVTSGSEFYDRDELYWLAKIISAESRGEPLDGQIAVGNVVMNRVAYDEFPNTIYDVIFDRRGGVQFSPVLDGSIYNEATAKSVIAAKLVLDGANTAGDCLYFMNESIATSTWMKSRTFYTSIGDHDFYQ